MNIERYNKIKKLNSEFLPVTIKSFIPTPTEAEYKRGYITRYFVQKSNDRTAPIIEVNSKGFVNYNNNPFYIITSLKWVISDSEEAVKNFNLKSIQFASKNFKSLPFYLENLTQLLKK